MRSRYMAIHDHTERAEVDFLTDGINCTMHVAWGKLWLTVRVSHGEGSSSWDLHEFEVPLRKGDER